MAEQWTSRGDRYRSLVQEQAEKIWRSLEDAIWADPKPCACDNQHALGADGEWRCSFCQKVVALSAVARTLRNARAAEATDPRHRWCVKHDEPLWDEGGGPGPFSVCQRCYEGG